MIQEPKGSLVRRLSAMFSPVRLMPEDFTEPGPVVVDARKEALRKWCEEEDAKLVSLGDEGDIRAGELPAPGHSWWEHDMARNEALKIARIALYDVSIAPGGLVADSYRNRATRAIVQINALKIDGG